MSAYLLAIQLTYAAAALVLGGYALSQLHLLLRSRHDAPRPRADAVADVLVQLPIRNERTVVHTLLDHIAALDWPTAHLFIQVLDDSDDETVALVEQRVRALREQGKNISHVRRGTREGYKAGALAHGLTLNTAPYVAIFDADFRPKPDFLRQTVPVLVAHPELGLLQARWGHLNRDHSLFTRAQAFHLDAHFGIEQVSRSRAPLFMGFNGTGGVWRRACIDAAGGWSADSLTEDLDLSMRAQLAGWTLAYDDRIECPAELPETVPAIRSQQFRWMKGGAQVARKLLGRLWRTDLPLQTRVQASTHLLGGSVFVAVTLLLLLCPAIPLLQRQWELPWMAVASVPLQLSLAILLAFYTTSCMRRDGVMAGLRRMLTDFVPFMALSTGLALHNAAAVFDGWFGPPTPFVRTPKQGDGTIRPYQPAPTRPIVWIELLLALWATVGLVTAVLDANLTLALFLAVQAAGLGTVAGAALRGAR